MQIKIKELFVFKIFSKAGLNRTLDEAVFFIQMPFIWPKAVASLTKDYAYIHKSLITEK